MDRRRTGIKHKNALFQRLARFENTTARLELLAFHQVTPS
jgi:hypothetical protein